MLCYSKSVGYRLRVVVIVREAGMQRLNIKKISQSFFNIAPKKVETYQTNPFGASSKLNFITADVFENSKSENLITKISNSVTKRISAVQERVNSAVSFGKKIPENISRLWDHAKSIEITFEIPNLGSAIKNKLETKIGNIFSGDLAEKMPKISNKQTPENLSKLSVDDLEVMLKEEMTKIQQG